MKLRFVATCCLILACVALSFQTHWSQVHATAPTQGLNVLPGTWGSSGCEPWPGGPFVRREYKFGDRTFTRTITRFANGNCSIPTYRLRTEGSYRVIGASAIVPGAVDIELKPSAVSVTPLTTTAADLLNGSSSAPCVTGAWLIGSEQTLLPARGCTQLLVLPFRGGTEFDIARNDGQLSLGLWPADGFPPTLPERRPTLLGAGLLLVQAAPAPEILLPDSGADLTARPIHVKHIRD